MHDLLNEQIPSDDGDELADHDFDNVSQTGCNYEDNGKGLQLDVEKILGSGTEEVSQLIIFLEPNLQPKDLNGYSFDLSKALFL